MTVADILILKQGKATNQTIADMMLIEDRERRLALRRGDVIAANAHKIERDKLSGELK